MTAAALKDGQSIVECTDGVKGSACAFSDGTPIMWHWDSPVISATDEGSATVFINGYGVVLEGSAMANHPDGNPCVPSPVNHAPTLLPPVGGTVYIESKLAGRIGDKFNVGTSFDHEIITGSLTVFIG